MSEQYLKSGRGGAREGAGRPKGTARPEGRRDKNIGIRVNEEELAMIKAKAAESGKGLTDYIVDLIRNA